MSIGPLPSNATRAALTTTATSVKSSAAAVVATSKAVDADLDLFLFARASERGSLRLPKSLQALLHSQRPALTVAGVDAESPLHDVDASAWSDVERAALHSVEPRLSAVMQLDDKALLAMLPRAVTERLERHLFEPLRVLLSDVLPPDDAVPVTVRNVRAGDRVAVPTRDGQYVMGTVTRTAKTTVTASFLDEKTGMPHSKTVTDAELRAANPAKIGDTFRSNGVDVAITHADAHGIRVIAEFENGVVIDGDASLLETVKNRSDLDRRHDVPVEMHDVDVSILHRTGKTLGSIERFRAGDFVAVPHSNGSFSKGILVNVGATSATVELKMGAQSVVVKVPLEAFKHANPAKIGDRFQVGELRVEVLGVDDRGLMGRTTISGSTSTVGSENLHALGTQLMQRSPLRHAIPTATEMVGLSQQQQRVVRTLYTLIADPVFGNLEAAVRKLRASESFVNASPPQRSRMLDDLMRSDNSYFNVYNDSAVTRQNSAAVTVSGSFVTKPGVEFRVANGRPPKAHEYEITVRVASSQQQIRVVLPATMSAQQETQKLQDIASQLRRLPPEAVTHIHAIIINPEANPEDAQWAERFNIPGLQSCMSAREGTHDVTVYIDDLSRAVQQFTHEVGHFVAEAFFGEATNKSALGKWDAWIAAQESDVVSVSQYAKKSEGEDFAETYSLYMTTKNTDRHDIFRNLMPARFAILDIV
jgi:hypothetical protein